MTNKTAHQMLRLEHNRISPTNPKSKAIELALQALDKQIPEPAIHCGEVRHIIDRNGACVDAEFRDWVECPVCRNRVGYYNDYDAEDLQLQNFCDECGQALKEPEEEE